MPIYESLCKECGKHHEYYSPVARCYETPFCCFNRTEKAIFTAPAGMPDISPYQSPVDGRIISSRSQRRDDFARHNARPWEGREQEQKEANRRKREIEAKQDAKLDTAVQTAYHQLSPEKRKIIDNH